MRRYRVIKDSMLRNYLHIAVRNLFRQKGFAIINILGLSLGITCFILIALYIQDELSFDRFHEKADRIYRVTERIGTAEHSSSQPFSLAPTIAEDFPAMIEHAVRLYNTQAPTLTLESNPETRFNESRFFFVDSTVFDVFTFPFSQGNPETALMEPYSVVLTQEMANKYFGTQDVLGKTLRFEGKHELHITGVVYPVPENAHFKFDFLASFSTVTGIQNGQKPEGWNWNPCWTYLLLTRGTDPALLAQRLPDFVTAHFPDNIREKTSLHLQALTDIHLHSHLDYEIAANSDIAYIYVFSIIAAMVLLIACINYMNLATARAVKRAREVGMRKVLGAHRSQLIYQFLGESFVVSTISATLAIPMVYFALPILNGFLDKGLTLQLTGNWLIAGSLISVILLVGFVAGIYPAFVLSGFRPVQVLKNRLYANGYDLTAGLRKGLVTLQFLISIILIIGTLSAFKQLQFMQQANLGFDKEQVIMVNIFRSNLVTRYDEFKNRLLADTHVRFVTTSEDVLGSKCQTNPFKPEGYTEYQQLQRLMVGYDFVETFDLHLVAGRSFDKLHLTDDSLAVLINETMVDYLGWGTAEQALGKGFTGRKRSQIVIGVLKDFHYTSLHNPIGPFILDIADTDGQHNFFDRYLAVRIAPENYQETIAHIEKTWSEFFPERPFEYFFMDDALGRLYVGERSLSRVAGTFAAFALFVACIGLLGIVSFVVDTRVKEIGIRKILGATTSRIIKMLAQDFLKLVVIALFLATPIAWWLMQRWLDNFAYRIHIPWWIFALSGILTITIAFMTIFWQSLRAALTNPAQSLRSE